MQLRAGLAKGTVYLYFRTRDEVLLALAQRLAALGRRVETLYPALRAGEGAALLINSYALIVGLWQQADIPPVLREAMARPDLKVFRMDFKPQLERALLDLWEAAERRGGRGAQP